METLSLKEIKTEYEIFYNDIDDSFTNFLQNNFEPLYSEQLNFIGYVRLN